MDILKKHSFRNVDDKQGNDVDKNVNLDNLTWTRWLMTCAKCIHVRNHQ